MVSQLDAAFNYNDLHGLNDVKAKARADDPAALRVVAQQFESMFISMVLKSMREATDVMSSDMLNSNETKFYRDMHDQQLSLTLSQQGGYGLADTLYEQLLRQLPDRPEAGTVPNVRPLNESNRPILPVPATPRETVAPVESPSHETTPDGPSAFINRIAPYAEQAAAELGVDPRVLIAQAALETGWGQHMIQRDDGGNSHNFFGIKADSRWQGDSAETLTHEYIDGTAITLKDRFRAYNSPAESFSDYVRFLTDNPRYQPALAQAGSPEGYARALQQAGYATDPAYADKILRIADSDLMRTAMSGSGASPAALG
ncbi:MAG: flagellar assembly peptidoglycan hydrolase FlgJ [Saccharospirillum sp.]